MSNPKLRFRQKNGNKYSNFKQKKFGDISISHNIRNKKCLDLEIYSINNQVGFVPQSEQFEDAGYLNDTDTSIYMIVPPNHFAYNPARINVGSIGYQNIGYDVQVSSLYEVFKTTNECNDMFIWHWFHTSLFKRMVRKYAEGGVRVYYYYDKLCETPIMLPCLEEQQKIANLISSVDEAIAQSEAEVSNLQQQKKAAMQKIFSREVRFKREDGTDYPEWGTTFLNDACDIVGGGTPSTENKDYWNGNIQWFTPSEIGKSKYVSKSAKTISQIGFEKSSARKLPVGTILLTSRATLGEMAITTEECATNQGFQSLIPRKIYGEYLYYLQPTIKNYCYKKACGSTFNEISKGELGKCKIPYPHLEEQKTIANFLSAYDEAISYARQEFDKWKELKKGLLQQMFV